MAGLTCATYLHRAGRAVRVLEAADAVGGRVRTDLTADGFRLDRGFQVLLTNYPETKRLLDYQALNLRKFSSGAVIRLEDGEQTTLQNPWQRPLAAVSALTSPIGSFADKLRILSLVRHVLRHKPDELLARPGMDTLTFLRRYGWSETMINRFFRPFFGGVFLDRELGTASNFFEFVFQQFVTGDAAVPALGMQQIPAQLAARLPIGTVQLNTTVAAIEGRAVRLAGGETLTGSAVVLATDGPAAAALLAGAGTGRPAPAAGRRSETGRPTTCTYFATGGGYSPGRADRLLRLNAAPLPALAHNVAFPADVSPAYAPAGQHLVSVSTHGEHGLPEAELTERLRAELAAWFGPAARQWRHLRTYRIDYGLPVYAAGDPARQPPRLAEGLYRAGDWSAYPSLNAAMATGREVAELLLVQS